MAGEAWCELPGEHFCPEVKDSQEPSLTAPKRKQKQALSYVTGQIAALLLPTRSEDKMPPYQGKLFCLNIRWVPRISLKGEQASPHKGQEEGE